MSLLDMPLPAGASGRIERPLGCDEYVEEAPRITTPAERERKRIEWAMKTPAQRAAINRKRSERRRAQDADPILRAARLAKQRAQWHARNRT